ncbi:crossover junction endodeoxyribonuclease RuvC [Opitutus sp. GAS368]|jgi:crossover junction endodeoxyribonuclease RuvC|uniref:crossover junction endodeoxyribonuclease RuvC n=1 Tax=Opitutus sp. GAS368 TaxID=1882749 RepID=UPI00087C71FE|nr:crossover junction endodeoxyribonuclease RuvC [Opitutus sp. GAS368]SDR66015.1 Holliday junction endonuclease RuvC [Opitutus sp. GAS368]
MARTSVRQMWKAKLEGNLAPKAWPDAPALARPAFTGRVLGVDPSLRGTGLALIEFAPGRTPVLLRCLTVKVAPRASMAFCLGEIHRAVAAFVVDFDPRHVALEQTIYVQNFQTAQILGAARGAAIAAAALQRKEIFEYAPLRVKQAVVGQGRASKDQMARTVMALLGHGRALAFDESDAAGVALCHAFTWRG